MNKQETKLFAFLIGNMKDMEIELRAQSIVFEALSHHVIEASQMGDALTLARGSTEMLNLIREKYRLLAKGDPCQFDTESDHWQPEPGSLVH